jgi:hypothetical protein
MNIDEAKAAVLEAMNSVNPSWKSRPGQVGGTMPKVIPRGNVFDVLIANPGRLFSEYRAAIITELGDAHGRVDEA